MAVAKIITGDLQQPQEIENLGIPIPAVFMHRALTLQKSLEKSVLMIHPQTGQIDIISVDIQHQDLAITAMVMVAVEEMMIGGSSRSFIYR